MDAKTHLDYFCVDAGGIIIAPLVARAELMGLIIAINKIGESAFTRDDRELVKNLSIDIAVAIQNTHLTSDRTHNERQNCRPISCYLYQTLDIDELIHRILQK
jgi:hypothetical protein